MEEKAYQAFLSDSQQTEKNILLKKLCDSKSKMHDLIEKLNHTVDELDATLQEMNIVVQAINRLVKKIYDEKSSEIENSKELEKNHTLLTDLHCYNYKFEKVKLKLPEKIQESDLDCVDLIIDELDEMP